MHFIWSLPCDLVLPAIYAAAKIAHRVIAVHKPHLHDKGVILKEESWHNLRFYSNTNICQSPQLSMWTGTSKYMKH
jgi:hypothetical protein